LASLTGNAPIIVQCKVEKAICHRLCGELEQCAEILNQLRTGQFTPESQLRIEAEWIRYNIAIGNVAEVRQQYAADRDSQPYPDFELARLELFLVSDPSRNIQPQSTVVMRLGQKIDRDFGSYWAKRAGMVVSVSGNRDLNSAEMLAMYADKYLQDQQFIEAAKQYEQAAAKADANRQPEKMYQYNRLAVYAWSQALEQLPTDAPRTEYQKLLVALLRTLVAQNPNHHEALDLHLSAIDLQARIVSTQPEALDDYLALVKEHEEYWKDSPQLQKIRRQTVILLERQGRIDEAADMLPLLGLEQMKTLPLEIQRLRARQLDAEGKTQSAVDLLAAILKQKREPATLQLLAEILTRQSDGKSWDYAQKLWTELTLCTAKESEMWWTAREGILEVFCKLNRRDEAKKEFEKLRILYPNLGGIERKERLVKRFE
jgi:tetratricopeptide (TPR) repeat protein